MAPPTPRLNGSRTTWAPALRATAAVPSPDPSSTTRMSRSGWDALTSAMVPAMAPASFHAGMTTRMRWSGRPDMGGTLVGGALVTSSGRGHARPYGDRGGDERREGRDREAAERPVLGAPRGDQHQQRRGRDRRGPAGRHEP